MKVEVKQTVRLAAPPAFEAWINGFLAWVQLEKVYRPIQSSLMKRI